MSARAEDHCGRNTRISEAQGLWIREMESPHWARHPGPQSGSSRPTWTHSASHHSRNPVTRVEGAPGKVCPDLGSFCSPGNWNQRFPSLGRSPDEYPTPWSPKETLGEMGAGPWQGRLSLVGAGGRQLVKGGQWLHKWAGTRRWVCVSGFVGL